MRIGVLLTLCALSAASGSAQMRGGTAGHGAPPRGSVGPHGRAAGRAHTGIGRGAVRGRSPGYGPRSYGPYGLGFFDPLNDVAPYYGEPEEPAPAAAPQPNVIVMSPAPPMNLQRPIEAHPVVLEVAPAANAGPASNAPVRPFEIVLKDGTVRQAIGVVVDQSTDSLKYVDPDGQNVQVPLADVDRQATRTLNRQRNLNLWLP
jgi:hypothetical protein